MTEKKLKENLEATPEYKAEQQAWALVEATPEWQTHVKTYSGESFRTVEATSEYQAFIFGSERGNLISTPAYKAWVEARKISK
jgi:hypothetical protein